MNMITDRSQQDVARWFELRNKGWAAMSDVERIEWMGDMKGCYSHVDMNRVENAVKSLSARLVAGGYLDSPLTVKTNWTQGDCPSIADMERYLNNVAALRNASAVYPTTPAAPSITDRFDYERANDLEKILIDVEEIFDKILSSRYYVGETYSGEV